MTTTEPAFYKVAEVETILNLDLRNEEEALGHAPAEEQGARSNLRFVDTEQPHL